MSEIAGNNQSGQLGTNVSAVAAGTSQVIANFFAIAPDFPAISSPNYAKIEVDPGKSTYEILYLTSYTPGQLGGTFTRGAEDATNWPPSAHTPGAVWVNAPTVGDFASFVLQSSVGAVSGVAPLDGSALVPVANLPFTNTPFFLIGGLAGVAPSNSVGLNGDYCLDTSNGAVWGPKASGAWPGTAGVVLGQRTVLATSAPGATPSINATITDVAIFTALATPITSMTTNLTGTFTAGQQLTIKLTDNGTAQGVAWGTKFVGSTVSLPSTTVANTMLTCYFEYDAAAATPAFRLMWKA